MRASISIALILGLIALTHAGCGSTTAPVGSGTGQPSPALQPVEDMTRDVAPDAIEPVTPATTNEPADANAPTDATFPGEQEPSNPSAPAETKPQ